MSDLTSLSQHAAKLAQESQKLSLELQSLIKETSHISFTHEPITHGLTIFVLACFVGYYVVLKVTPALHTPLMAVTNAMSGIVIIGAIMATGLEGFGISQLLGFLGVVFASINIFGGFIVAQRMLHMFKQK